MAGVVQCVSPPARPTWLPAFLTAPANSAAASVCPPWPPSPHSALRTGTATDPAALNDGYALGLAVTASLFVLAAVVAIGVLPRHQAAMPDPQPDVPTKDRLEGT